MHNHSFLLVIHLLYEELITWKGVAQPSHNLKFLKQEESWSKDIIQYGKLDETCIEFFYKKGVLEEISCRLDLRSLTKKELISLIEYVQKIEAMFLVDNIVCLPRLEDLLFFMRKSKTNLFCKYGLEHILFDEIV